MQQITSSGFRIYRLNRKLNLPCPRNRGDDAALAPFFRTSAVIDVWRCRRTGISVKSVTGKRMHGSNARVRRWETGFSL